MKLIDRRSQTFLARYGTPMPGDNVWLAERSAEQSALDRILAVFDSFTPNGGEAVRGAGVASNAPTHPKEAT